MSATQLESAPSLDNPAVALADTSPVPITDSSEDGIAPPDPSIDERVITGVSQPQDATRAPSIDMNDGDHPAEHEDKTTDPTSDEQIIKQAVQTAFETQPIAAMDNDDTQPGEQEAVPGPESFALSSIIMITFGDKDKRVIAIHESRIDEECKWLRAAIAERWGGQRIVDARHVSHDEMCVYVEWLYGPGNMTQLTREEHSWSAAELVSLMRFALAIQDEAFFSNLRDFLRSISIDRIIAMEPKTIENLYSINDQGLKDYVVDMYLSYGKQHGLTELIKDLPDPFKVDLITAAIMRTELNDYDGNEGENNW